ncbi:hypothetical protein Avbf_05189 [Armadillidium vulgare]|nr:hypothetical protein Avbf_05189 [Armadillidium vulgare]
MKLLGNVKHDFLPKLWHNLKLLETLVRLYNLYWVNLLDWEKFDELQQFSLCKTTTNIAIITIMLCYYALTSSNHFLTMGLRLGFGRFVKLVQF